jgi:hypothetical protein
MWVVGIRAREIRLVEGGGAYELIQMVVAAAAVQLVPSTLRLFFKYCTFFKQVQK